MDVELYIDGAKIAVLPYNKMVVLKDGKNEIKASVFNLLGYIDAGAKQLLDTTNSDIYLSKKASISL